MQKKRSPKFPFVALKAALENIQTIHSKVAMEATAAPKVAEALGYEGMSGKVNKVISALVGYGLLEKTGQEDGVRVFKITDRGLKLSQNAESAENLADLRQAALSPMPFRRIWFRRPNVTKEELQSALENRGFTPEGAERAANVYLANVQLADLENEEFRASGEIQKPEPPKKKAAKNRPEASVAPAPAGGTSGPMPQRLVVPVAGATAMIPAGMSEDEFDLLMRTLRIWKEKLVA